MNTVLMSMILTSTAFSHQGPIPSEYTCQGKDISPALSWSQVPAEAKSLALIMSDPDAPDPKAPKMTWMHWVLYNLPTDAKGLVENVSVAQLPKGTLMGFNGRREASYQGPCPPIGEHRYFFKLYALDTVLPDLKQPTAEELLTAMKGKIVGQTELIGKYSKH